MRFRRIGPILPLPLLALVLLHPSARAVLGSSSTEPLTSGASARAVVADGGDVSPAETRREWVERELASMTVRQKAAQMVMPWIAGGMAIDSRELAQALSMIRTHQVGGVILGKGDGERSRVALERLQREARVPLLVSSDLEWGPGMRLVGGTTFPVAMAVGASGDPELAYALGRATALEGRAAGVHMAFAPVADVNVNPRNPIINTRAYGESPVEVGRFVSAHVRGLQDGGMLAVAKHFPGHGDTETDSHLALPVITASRARLDSVELVPFDSALAARVAGIMTAHIAVPALSGNRRPATLEPAILARLLRDERRFDGLVITDALNMRAVTRGEEAASVVLDAVRAGADILLQPVGTGIAIDAIVEAVDRGELKEARLDASVRRILASKAALGITDATPPSSRQLSAAELRGQRELAERVAARSVVLLRESAAGGARTLGATKSAVVVAYADRAVPGGTGAALASALRAEGWTVELRVLPARLRADSARALASRLAADQRALVIATFTSVAPWSGAITVPAPVRTVIEATSAARPVALVSFGDPYLLARYPRASTALAAWSNTAEAQRAAALVLTGRADVSGRLPITISPAYRLGHGLQRQGRAGD